MQTLEEGESELAAARRRLAQLGEELQSLQEAKEDADRQILLQGTRIEVLEQEFKDQLREIGLKFAELEKKVVSSRWLLKAVRKKIAHAPRDVSRRMRGSWRKRRGTLSRAVDSEGNFRLSRLFDRRYRKYFSSWLLLRFEPVLSRRFADRMRRRMTRHAPARGVTASALGHLDVAGRFPVSGGVVIAGWEIHGPQVQLSIESDRGAMFPLDQAFRFCRQDVADRVYGTLRRDTIESGFVIYLPDAGSAKTFRLIASSSEGQQNLSEAKIATIGPGPRQAAEWLFGIPTPLADLHKRIPLIDKPALAPLIDHARTSWDKLRIRTKQLGPTDDVRVSIIVPLFKRCDFVEHQLMEFCEDRWLRQHAELIYAVDDPALVDDFAPQAEALYRLYQMPFRWVWGGANRGFSGANNLGANHARGEYLVFLNSDVFPQRPGWLEPLIDVLEQRPEIGAVGPRLVFPDGKIQHAGMAFVHRHDLGIWINDHPHKGIDPSLDPHRDVAIVPAVTGACLVVRRADFDRIDGWDTDYLIGDFEDSDLCLKLRSEGLLSAYVPSVQLVHLERQSFKFLGDNDFRVRVTIFNACRHQARWAGLLDQAPHTQNGATFHG